jgi:hypothetical protein
MAIALEFVLIQLLFDLAAVIKFQKVALDLAIVAPLPEDS